MTPSDLVSRLRAHKRAAIVVIVLTFVAVFAGIGAVSRNSPTTPTTPAVADPATGPGMVPYASWYWTMAVGRTNPDVLVLGTSAGLYRTTNGGASWKPVGPAHVNATSLVDAGSTIYLGGAQIASIDTSPVIRSGTGRTVSNGAAVLATSSDEGATWQVLHPSGLPSVAIQALAIDASHGSTLYALLNTGALYRSTDGGTSFQLVSPRLGISPWAIAITENSQFVGGDMDSGSHVSATGKAWQVIPFTDASGGRMVMEYAVQPAHTTRIVMTSIGVVVSTDGGKTWHIALKSQTMFGPVAFSPSNPELAFAVDFSQHLWRSTNGGTSWSEVK